MYRRNELIESCEFSQTMALDLQTKINRSRLKAERDFKEQGARINIYDSGSTLWLEYEERFKELLNE